MTRKEKWREGLEVIAGTMLVQLIKGVNNFLNGSGTHSAKEREREDAWLAIRLTEDVMIRVVSEKAML